MKVVVLSPWGLAPLVIFFFEGEGGGGEGLVEGGGEEFGEGNGAVALFPLNAFEEGGFHVDLEGEVFDGPFEFSGSGEKDDDEAGAVICDTGDFECLHHGFEGGAFTDAEHDEEGSDFAIGRAEAGAGFLFLVEEIDAIAVVDGC